MEAVLSEPRTRETRLELDEIRDALRRYRTEFVLLLTDRGEIVTSSEGIMLGYGDDTLGQNISERVHPDDLPQLIEVIQRVRGRVGVRDTVRARGRRLDGSWGTFEVTVIDASEDLDAPGTVLRVRDVSDEVQRHAGVPDLGAGRFESLAAALPFGLLSADASGSVVFCNHTLEQILNVPADDLMGHGWVRAVHPDDRDEVLDAARGVMIYGLPQQAVFRVQNAVFARWAHAKFVPLGGAERTTGWIATVDDITDRRRAESRLSYQATHDPLTKLPNRLLLEDRLRQACARLRRGTSSVSVLFIDLDGFKAINDTLGHRAGDRVLVEVAKRIRRAVRDVDTVARYAGDEFVVICESIAPDEIRYVVRRIIRAVERGLVADGHGELHISASIGVATTTEPDTRLEDILARADQDMYRNKRER